MPVCLSVCPWQAASHPLPLCLSSTYVQNHARSTLIGAKSYSLLLPNGKAINFFSPRREQSRSSYLIGLSFCELTREGNGRGFLVEAWRSRVNGSIIKSINITPARRRWTRIEMIHWGSTSLPGQIRGDDGKRTMKQDGGASGGKWIQSAIGQG